MPHTKAAHRTRFQSRSTCVPYDPACRTGTPHCFGAVKCNGAPCPDYEGMFCVYNGVSSELASQPSMCVCWCRNPRLFANDQDLACRESHAASPAAPQAALCCCLLALQTTSRFAWTAPAPTHPHRLRTLWTPATRACGHRVVATRWMRARLLIASTRWVVGSVMGFVQPVAASPTLHKCG